MTAYKKSKLTQKKKKKKRKGKKESEQVISKTATDDRAGQQTRQVASLIVQRWLMLRVLMVICVFGVVLETWAEGSRIRDLGDTAHCGC
jgi:predicted anti-sigma-YlaC factor YlaD